VTRADAPPAALEFGFWGAITHVLHDRTDLGPVDFAALRRRPSGNDALICPPGFCAGAAPDAPAPVFNLSPDALDARLAAMARADANVEELPGSAPMHRRFVQRTSLLGYPDLIDALVLPSGADGATLALYSRSLVGRKDFGVNRARLARWLAALGAVD
jgi:hypothetical protein